MNIKNKKILIASLFSLTLIGAASSYSISRAQILRINFGGEIVVQPQLCCDGSWLVTVGGINASSPGNYIYRDGATDLNMEYQIYRGGVDLVGNADPITGYCVLDSGGCQGAGVPYRGQMYTVGTNI